MTRAVALAGLTLLAAAPAEVVTVEPPPELRLRPGGAAEAVVGVEIREGFKVQANPAAEEYLVPLRLEVPDAGGVRLLAVEYPEPERHRLKGATSDLLVYEGSVELRLAFEAAPEAAPGPAAVEGRLHFQACDARVCLRPASTPVRLEVRIDPDP